MGMSKHSNPGARLPCQLTKCAVIVTFQNNTSLTLTKIVNPYIFPPEPTGVTGAPATIAANTTVYFTAPSIGNFVTYSVPGSRPNFRIVLASQGPVGQWQSLWTVPQDVAASDANTSGFPANTVALDPTTPARARKAELLKLKERRAPEPWDIKPTVAAPEKRDLSSNNLIAKRDLTSNNLIARRSGGQADPNRGPRLRFNRY
ncbi:hypothetical protein H072_9927 [Dactylellina haptotyla CBS 200.50]|uniref:Uncharacterized protein n=1 Tax=Dactylellina haptotyla (strain CBS 200.50) TaxID=1284197 RepID=S8BMU5_DACHA|nr:hypothetical protein H072_9927 [Dactylellina haptotyla CBS 200.50]